MGTRITAHHDRVVVAQVDIVPREERCDDGPRPQPMQPGPGEQHMGMPQRPPGMQMDPAMMQAYYMVRTGHF